MVEHQRHLQWTIRHPDQNSNLNHYQYIQTDPQWKNQPRLDRNLVVNHHCYHRIRLNLYHSIEMAQIQIYRPLNHLSYRHSHLHRSLSIAQSLRGKHHLADLQNYLHNRHHLSPNIVPHSRETYRDYYRLNYPHNHHRLNRCIVLGR